MPKGPSLDPADKRMAVHVEDHPIDYGRFEGTIPKGQYGAGEVIVWDNGTWEPVGDPEAGYRAGKLKFRLAGKKLHGGWTLVRMHGRAGERQEPWLLIKERDDAARPSAEYSVVEAEPKSVLSDRTIADRPTAAPKEAARDDSSARDRGEEDRSEEARAAKTTAAKTAAKKTSRAAKRRGSRRRRAAGAAAPARSRRSCPRPSARSSPRSSARRRATAAGSTRSSSTAIACSPASTATTCASSRAAATTGPIACRASSTPSRSLGIGSGWLDGEIVVSGANGAPDFNALQNAFDSARTDDIQYYVFDLPYYAGHDLRSVPLVERRAVLAAALDRAPPHERVRFSQDFDSSPTELLQNACRMRLEGMIGKRADAPYVSRRSPTWIKLKCTQRQEFVVGGWTDPQGSRTGIGSLLLGIHDEAGHLRFAGGVGSGFDQKALAAVRKALESRRRGDDAVLREAARRSRPLGRSRCSSPRSRSANGRPTAGSATRSSTACATTRMRAPSLASKPSIRRDATVAQPAGKTKAAKSTRASDAAKVPARRTAKSAGDATVEGIRISHPDRVIDASTGITKLEVVNYYLDASRLILPHLVKRPVSLVRAPGRARRPARLPAPRGQAPHPRAARARSGVLARPRADGRGRFVHRADRLGAGQRDRVPHLERDDARSRPSRPRDLRSRSRRRRRLVARCRKAPS